MVRLRHATDADLDAVESLLAELRRTPGLRERKRGSFSRGSHAFLHFHADDAGCYADVRFDAQFERVPVTNQAEQTKFLELVRRAVVH